MRQVPCKEIPELVGDDNLPPKTYYLKPIFILPDLRRSGHKDLYGH